MKIPDRALFKLIIEESTNHSLPSEFKNAWLDNEISIHNYFTEIDYIKAELDWYDRFNSKLGKNLRNL